MHRSGVGSSFMRVRSPPRTTTGPTSTTTITTVITQQPSTVNHVLVQPVPVVSPRNFLFEPIKQPVINFRGDTTHLPPTIAKSREVSLTRSRAHSPRGVPGQISNLQPQVQAYQAVLVNVQSRVEIGPEVEHEGNVIPIVNSRIAPP